MRPMNKEEVVEAFDPVDRKQLSLTALVKAIDETCWNDLDYFSWQDESGIKSFVVMQLPERTVGLVFRYNRGQTVRGGVCSLCLTTSDVYGTRSAMVDSWDRPRRSYGIHVCSHFDCSKAVREIRPAGFMMETLAVGHRVERLQQKLERFVRKVTNLDHD